MSTSPLRRAVAWTLPAALVVSSVAVAATSATAAPTAPAAAPTVKAQATGGDTIVGLGDSYMSGEGVMYANHNFPGAESSTPSNWQTGPGALGQLLYNYVFKTVPYGNSNPPASFEVVPQDNAMGKTWRSVFGDANGWPNVATGQPMGVETIPMCDRSYAAAMNVGSGWNAANLACSGATYPNQVKSTSAQYKTTLFGTAGVDFNYGKPGVEFDPVTVPEPNIADTVPGQARQLQDFAEQTGDIKVVALSIGGNDFGFGDIGTDCVISGTLGQKCENSQATLDKVAAGLPRATNAVKHSIENVTLAMQRAGYKPGEWKLVFQNPPLPVAKGEDTKWEWSSSALGLGGTRGSLGGCGLADSTFDWVVGEGGLYSQLESALRKGIKQAKAFLGPTQVVQIDTTDTFVGHRLCEKGTVGQTNYQQNQSGKTPPWQKDNGKGTEWVTYISKTDFASGNIYQKSMPLHPNYWGQRALAACMAKAIDVAGSVTIGCKQDSSEELNDAGQPKMNVFGAEALWINVVGTPVITGNPNVGRTVTAATTGVFDPEVDYDFEYQWYADGTAIAGADAKTLALTAGHLGKRITVKVTAQTKSGDGTIQASATSDAVEVSDIIVNVHPVISGPAKVGKVLSVSSGTYNVTPDSISYQWLRDGEEIEGATVSSYTAVGADAGARLSVRVTVDKATYEQLVLNTDESPEVATGDMGVTGRPTVSGKPIVGQVLTANAGAVSFSPSADRVSYRWYRNGTLIKGAEAATYEVTGDDFGASLSVRVVGHKEGYEDAESMRSAGTGDVVKGRITTLKDPSLEYTVNGTVLGQKIKKKKARYGFDLQANIWDVFSEWPTPAKVTWTQKAKGKTKKIKSAKDDYSWTPGIKDIGTKVRVTIESENEGYEQASATTAWYTIVKGKHVPFKAPKVKGKTKVGQKLRATAARFLPAAAGEVEYRWFADNTRIKGAVGRSFRLTPDQKGKDIRVQAYVPASKGYVSSQVKSKPVGPVKAVKGLG